MMHDWWGYGVPGLGMAIGPLMMVSVAVLFVVLLAYVIRAITSRAASPDQEYRPTATDILRERFARGEIDRTEFEERKRALSGS